MTGMVGSMCTMHTLSLFHTAKPSGFRSGSSSPSSSMCKDSKSDDPDTLLRNYISLASPEDRKQLFERYQSKMKEIKAKRSPVVKGGKPDTTKNIIVCIMH